MLTHWSAFFSFRFYGLLIGRSTLFMALDSGGGGGGRGALLLWPSWICAADLGIVFGRTLVLNTVHNFTNIRGLKRRHDNDWREKSNRFKLAKQQLCTCFYAFLYTVLSLRFCRGREHRTTNFLFSSWTLTRSFRIQLQKNCQQLKKGDGMRAIKFEAARIQFWVKFSKLSPSL